ncbi:LssY C-terminal domain-containing protein (plasmid) [Photobacterium sp. DA100]|uniref:LssY C-terminal domain-containing protein n=1 Tax=Photobacterium sp. DA100 TaxID=3027472 RepID=UPI0024790091|nr:LssY C-terminal domain-containing protein [Photobacterium sp. DA100]WEM45543.1 LssY C-terminal domain-containing protein [Photobacterium sp. DA100]
MHDVAWWWYFGGSLLDALIGPNLFFPGEPFLLAAGYLLSHGAIYGVLAVLAGGFIGDQISFFIGRRFGARGRRWLVSKFSKTKRPIAKARLILQTKGPWIVTASRLLGPVAWIMPFIAGSYAMRWSTFTLYSSIGLILGVGQFTLAGFFIGKGIDVIPSWQAIGLFFQEHSVLLTACLISLLATVILYRVYRWRKWLLIACCWLTALGAANYYHFFHSDAYQIEWLSKAQANSNITALQDDKITLDNLSYTVYPGLSPVYKAQPINVVLYGEHPSTLMEELGWVKNKTFSRDTLNLSQYLELIAKQQPPISDLYWNQQPQLLAYQIKGDLINRRHIRWWFAGKSEQTGRDIWVASISYDNRLKLAHYKGLITILHGIDPDTDQERDTLMKNAEVLAWRTELRNLAEPIAYSKSNHYFSDGKVAVIMPN